jgi:flagellar motility protein MotE (MotC chaperone)
VIAGRDCFRPSLDKNAHMDRPLIVFAMVVPALVIAVALLGVTSLRERARRTQLASEEQVIDSRQRQNQRLAQDLAASRLHDQQQQLAALATYQSDQQRLAELQRQLREIDEALRQSRDQIKLDNARIEELSKLVVKPSGEKPAAPLTKALP